jgi:hypothetical protein
MGIKSRQKRKMKLNKNFDVFKKIILLLLNKISLKQK